MSGDAGKTWKRRTLALYENGLLAAFKHDSVSFFKGVLTSAMHAKVTDIPTFVWSMVGGVVAMVAPCTAA